MTFRPVLSGRTKDNLAVDIVDITPMYSSDPENFKRLFKQGQRIYHNSFPPEEKESTDSIRSYIADTDAILRGGRYGEATFNYMVPVIDGKAEGMLSYSVVPLGDGSSQIFADCIASSKKHRRKGIGTMLADASAREGYKQSMEMRLGELKYWVAVVEQPALDYADKIRDDIRPKYHQEGSGLGAAAIVDRHTGEMIPVPFGQPGIKESQDSTPPPVPMVIGVAPVEEGSIRKIKARPGSVVSPSGELLDGLKDCATLGVGEFRNISDGMFEDYRTSVEGTYDPRQIDQIQAELQGSLERAAGGSVFLVPLSDTRYMRRAEYR